MATSSPVCSSLASLATPKFPCPISDSCTSNVPPRSVPSVPAPTFLRAGSRFVSWEDAYQRVPFHGGVAGHFRHPPGRVRVRVMVACALRRMHPTFVWTWLGTRRGHENLGRDEGRDPTETTSQNTCRRGGNRRSRDELDGVGTTDAKIVRKTVRGETPSIRMDDAVSLGTSPAGIGVGTPAGRSGKVGMHSLAPR
eukprot:scaffold762_cov363-Pavlova_lutheri.AAC.37